MKNINGITFRVEYAEYEWTYVRGCASLGNEGLEINKCHSYPGKSTETTVCFCSEDGCNGSQNLIGLNVILVFLSALSLNILI